MNINSVASDLNRKILLEYLSGKAFLLCHDLPALNTSIITDAASITDINHSAIGINVTESSEMPRCDQKFLCLSMAIFVPRVQIPFTQYPLDNMYRIFSNFNSSVFASFCPSSTGEITKLKHDTEEKLSRIEVRQSHGINSRETSRNSSTLTDSYYQSYEKRLLVMILDNMNDVLLSKYCSYKVAFLIPEGNNSGELVSYLKSNSIVLSQSSIRVKDLADLYYKAKELDSIPLSYANASQVIGFSNRIRRINRVSTSTQQTHGDLTIGKYIDSATNETNETIFMHSRALNLGTLITGLPGTGKTKVAKSIIGQSIITGCKVAVISPTSEWNSFAEKNSLKVVRLADQGMRINFFKCETTNVRAFYENLSMLLATGCNAGPYTSSIEKCLLSAFSKVYQNATDPDPQAVYGEIEESIIEQHAKRTHTSVKYTKHGENTRSALENLRQLLMMPQFAYSGGMSFAELLDNGVILDLSGVSNSSKALLYALLLNQIYNIADKFDLHGDDKLRLILCLEEAQLVFNAEDESSATLDLKERIQNFRKNGIGLILITHNLNDINPSIRRLCQNKLYFRQSSDIAKYAANDLIFDEDENEKIVSILKTLGQRECALNQVIVADGQKTVSSSIFSKIDNYHEPEVADNANGIRQANITTIITVKSQNPEALKRRYDVFYLGERIISKTSDGFEIREDSLLKGKIYKMVLIGDKKRDDREFNIIGGTKNTIEV